MITTKDLLPNGIKDHKNCLRNVNDAVKQLSFSYFELENAFNSMNKTKISTYPKRSKKTNTFVTECRMGKCFRLVTNIFYLRAWNRCTFGGQNYK